MPLALRTICIALCLSGFSAMFASSSRAAEPAVDKQSGLVIAEGPPSEVAKSKKSYTGKYLKETLRS